jgi:small subunit ribosomal protein S17
VEETTLHALLKKTVRRSKRYHAHDEDNAAVEGQTITIRECPPRSKLKRWEVISSDGGDA